LSSKTSLRVPFKTAIHASGRLLHFVQLTVRVESLNDGGSGTYVTCTVDSGSTLCVFDVTVAEKLGLVWKNGVRVMTMGIGGPKETYLHQVRLHLPGGPVSVLAAFQEALPVSGLLGMSGFFEHFRITFDGMARVCEFERLP